MDSPESSASQILTHEGNPALDRDINWPFCYSSIKREGIKREILGFGRKEKKRSDQGAKRSSLNGRRTIFKRPKQVLFTYS